MPVRHVRFARFDVLPPDCPRELLRRHFEIAVHEHDERRAGVVFHDERLDDGVLVDAEFAGRDAGAAVLLVAIHVLGERHAGGAKHADCWCGRSCVMSHGRSPALQALAGLL